MEILIQIPDDMFRRIAEAQSAPDMFGTDIVNGLNAIKGGTPLPKGHGRLIDADCLCTGCGIHTCDCVGDCDKCSDCVVSYDDIKNAETIIEADKG